ncbi:MAG: 2-amino-4-hydroxy-6-hydroxymethyldihydropteridine diphosphokinase [Bacteriovoracaceae bacterium]
MKDIIQNNVLLGLGSNLGDRKGHIEDAIEELKLYGKLIQRASYYSSAAVDYLDQPDFVNTVAHFQTKIQSPIVFLRQCLEIEKDLKRVRDIDKGPRTIDIDILFWNEIEHSSEELTVPHPSWKQRSFVVRPLLEIRYFQNHPFNESIPEQFDTEAIPI